MPIRFGTMLLLAVLIVGCSKGDPMTTAESDTSVAQDAAGQGAAAIDRTTSTAVAEAYLNATREDDLEKMLDYQVPEQRDWLRAKLKGEWMGQWNEASVALRTSTEELRIEAVYPFLRTRDASAAIEDVSPEEMQRRFSAMFENA